MSTHRAPSPSAALRFGNGLQSHGRVEEPPARKRVIHHPLHRVSRRHLFFSTAVHGLGRRMLDDVRQGCGQYRRRLPGLPPAALHPAAPSNSHGVSSRAWRGEVTWRMRRMRRMLRHGSLHPRRGARTSMLEASYRHCVFLDKQKKRLNGREGTCTRRGSLLRTWNLASRRVALLRAPLGSCRRRSWAPARLRAYCAHPRSRIWGAHTHVCALANEFVGHAPARAAHAWWRAPADVHALRRAHTVVAARVRCRAPLISAAVCVCVCVCLRVRARAVTPVCLHARGGFLDL
jgi:hypothetical protein